MYVVLLLAIFALAGAFATENEGTLVFRFFGYQGPLPTWAPTAIGVAAAAALLVVAIGSASLGSRLREIRHHREIARHREVIDGLLAENARLREAVAARRAGAAAQPFVYGAGRVGQPGPQADR
jgi:uncharacterized membrane protein YciS (DUF1049 family)